MTKGNVPLVCIANGYKLDDPPAELASLNALEESMVAPRLPFMQIRNVGFDSGKFLLGHVVNVPADVDSMVVSN